MPIERISLFCFGASYTLALGGEVLQLLSPRGVQRVIISVMATVGFLAHTLFLAVQRPSLSTQFGSLLFLAWMLAIFYIYGSVHHRRLAWGVFVLPVVLGLTLLAATFSARETVQEPFWDAFRGERFWGAVHGGLLLLASVGVCVGFVASVMYLIQSHRLRAKLLPSEGRQLLSLERLEMNRRAIIMAFPLLTLGLLVGAVLMWQSPAQPRNQPESTWFDPTIVGSAILWVVFALLLYLRYGAHLGGRRLAIVTILAFVLLLATLALPSHHFEQGGGP